MRVLNTSKSYFSKFKGQYLILLLFIFVPVLVLTASANDFLSSFALSANQEPFIEKKLLLPGQWNISPEEVAQDHGVEVNYTFLVPLPKEKIDLSLLLKAENLSSLNRTTVYTATASPIDLTGNMKYFNATTKKKLFATNFSARANIFDQKYFNELSDQKNKKAESVWWKFLFKKMNLNEYPWSAVGLVAYGYDTAYIRNTET